MNPRTFLLATAAVAALAGCGTLAGGPVATATLSPTMGNNTAGVVRFAQQQGGKVLVSGEISGLKPNGEHGFHVHEKGDCSSGDGMSAGGHFNPSGATHGAQAGAHHAGDMPNVRSDAYGNANVFFEIHGLTVAEGASSLVGRGLVLHRDADDYGTQPAGNAGPRIACAVIRRS
jgi:Cu-Zn family superoxide dismutase